MILEKVSDPAELPVTLHEAKTHAKVIGDVEDGLLQMWMEAATAFCEQSVEGGISLVSQVWRVTLPAFTTPIVLPRPPLVSVDSITYYDSDDTLQTLDQAEYKASTPWKQPGCVYPVDQWPETAARLDAVAVEFTAGYGDKAAVPAIAKSAILKTVTELFEQREDSVTGIPSNKTAIGVGRLMHKLAYGYYR